MAQNHSDPNEPLTPLQARFAEEYVVDCNAAAAYKRARPTIKSDEVAKVNGARMLTYANVQARVAALQAVVSDKTQLKAENVLRELAAIVFFDPRTLYNADGTLKPIRELDDRAAAALASVEVFEEFEGAGDNRRLTGYVRKVKHWGKVEAIKVAMQHLGLLKQIHEHGGKDGAPLFPTIDDIVAAVIRAEEAKPCPPNKNGS